MYLFKCILFGDLMIYFVGKSKFSPEIKEDNVNEIKVFLRFHH